MSDRFFVATRKGLFTVERRADRWAIANVSFEGDAVSLVHARGERLWAALRLGHFGVKLRRSEDGGRTWEELAGPSYPPKPEGYDDRDGMGKDVDWRVDTIWSLASGERPGVMWCGTIPGGLFRSDDDGATWSLVDSLWSHEQRRQWFGGGSDGPGIHSICIDSRDERRVTVAVSCGGVWTTEDDGATWSVRTRGMRAAYMPPERAEDPAIQDPHCLVQCATVPDVLWVQHHNGIFRSPDRGLSWTEVANARPSSFGFAVAVHPQDPNTAWFVPARSDEQRVPVEGRVVVSRTRDGGESFDVLHRGLPQQHAYDLVFRHALDVDRTGGVLAFGSTTGGLWTSVDGGEQWSQVNARLPPVYALRFPA